MKNVSLPYVDNAKAILITVIINIGVIFLFNWPGGVTYQGVIWDSLICAFVTVLLDMWIVYTALKKIRDGKGMPSQVPVSPLMQALPQNPFALGLIYAVVFGAYIVGINAGILYFFGIQSMSFAPWMIYKLIYATLLSAKIVEYCIFRYIQPDWANAENANTNTQTTSNIKPIKDPLPKISIFKEMYASVTGSIATSIIIGTALGGVKIGAGSSVVIAPTTVEGIPITGLVFGLITGILVTKAVLKELDTIIIASGSAMAEATVSDKWFTWMPVRKVTLMIFVCFCVMVFSAVALWLIMTLFSISVMNFYQHIVFMTVYAAIISKSLSYLLVKRCMQPDYIRYRLKTV